MCNKMIHPVAVSYFSDNANILYWYNLFLLSSSIASGIKLFLSQFVCALMQENRLPEGSNEKTLWLGW